MVAAELRHLLRDSALQTGHHGHAHKVQDPYSLRCVPQVHGAVRDTLDHLRRVLDIELNSATDNPLVFPGGGIADEATIATGGGRVISGGNFHGVDAVASGLEISRDHGPETGDELPPGPETRDANSSEDSRRSAACCENQAERRRPCARLASVGEPRRELADVAGLE